MDRGVVVDQYLESGISKHSLPGDIARWPDRLNRSSGFVEHSVVAERQGQTSGAQHPGRRERFDYVPFSDRTVRFRPRLCRTRRHWDRADIVGSLEGRDCAITYRRGGRKLAVAVVHRDLEGLRRRSSSSG